MFYFQNKKCSFIGDLSMSEERGVARCIPCPKGQRIYVWLKWAGSKEVCNQSQNCHHKLCKHYHEEG